jgi:hypothetical protein
MILFDLATCLNVNKQNNVRHLCADKTLCISHENICDGVKNCPDNSDEEGCGTCKFEIRFISPEGIFLRLSNLI